jgi:putative endonuclease
MTSTKDASPTRHLALGRYGERVAARHLVDRGLVLLDRNWRCEAGEIDLVLRDGDVLVVCEVKTRTSDDRGTPHEAVTAEKLDRLKRLGLCWAEAHGVHPDDLRIDLVAVHPQRRGAALVEHVPGLV